MLHKQKPKCVKKTLTNIIILPYSFISVIFRKCHTVVY